MCYNNVYTYKWLGDWRKCFYWGVTVFHICYTFLVTDIYLVLKISEKRHNYVLWKYRLELLLNTENLWDVIEIANPGIPEVNWKKETPIPLIWLVYLFITQNCFALVMQRQQRKPDIAWSHIMRSLQWVIRWYWCVKVVA